jgi:hypothetical protein
MERITPSIGPLVWEGIARVRDALVGEECDERVFHFAGLVALQRECAGEEGNACFEDFEELIRLPPDEVREAHGQGLSAACGCEADGQRRVADCVAEIREDAGVAELLERGFDVSFAEGNTLLQTADAKELRGVDVTRGVAGLEDDGLRLVRLRRERAGQSAGESQHDDDKMAHSPTHDELQGVYGVGLSDANG